MGSVRARKAWASIAFGGLTGAGAIWAGAALWIDGFESPTLSAVTTAAFIGGVLAVAVRMRPRARALGVVALAVATVAFWWLSLAPRADRDWIADVARSPVARFDGDRVTVSNVRNFRYRSEHDYDERWEERTIDLSQVVAADLFFSQWGSPWIAHTIISWRFGDGSHLAISIETRKESGEEYSALLGFFRQYELYYVVADERDVVGLRAAHRGERIELYRLRVTPGVARKVLEDYLTQITRLAEQPRWYNALTTNCTTSIRDHVLHVGAGNPWNWRILVNGFLPELGYMRGTIDTSLPLEELRRRSDITAVAADAADQPDFSSRIRVGLPGMDRPEAGPGL